MKSSEENSIFNITILTLYPSIFFDYLKIGVLGRALDKSIWSLNVIDIRDFAESNYKKVDDKPYGGGRGLLIKPDILSKSLEFAFSQNASKDLIFPSPQGKPFVQKTASQLSKKKGLTFICGHFEGIDDRFIQKYQPMEFSIGDYILSGGELSTMVIIDTVLRLIPNVLNSPDCAVQESFSNNMLEYPQYTKPMLWDNMKVPEILLSGNHKKINEWRKEQSLKKTKSVRPDLYIEYIKSKK